MNDVQKKELNYYYDKNPQGIKDDIYSKILRQENVAKGDTEWLNRCIYKHDMAWHGMAWHGMA